MKSLLALIICLVTASTAVADNNPDEYSYFDTLRSWYQNGSRLSFKDFKGFYSGRCFRKGEPNRPIGAMVGYYKFPFPPADVGPGLKDPPKFKIEFIRDRTNTPGVFDTDFPANKRLYYDVILSSTSTTSRFSESPTLGYTVSEKHNGAEVRNELVSYQNYLVMRLVDLNNRTTPVFAMCYFFRKLD